VASGKHDRLLKEVAATFARNLDQAIKASPLEARELAALLDMSPSYLSTLRHGGRKPNVALAALIAKALGVSLDSLAYGEEASEASAAEAELSAFERTLDAEASRRSAQDPQP
jgi:transcriptional regulator with XRE-family HTH domain